MFRFLFHLTPLIFKAELIKMKHNSSPFCSIPALYSSHYASVVLPTCSSPHSRRSSQLCQCMRGNHTARCLVLIHGLGCSDWFWFTVDWWWLIALQSFAGSYCRHLFKIYHSCRLSSRGTLLHWWWSFGKRGQKLQRMHLSWTTSVSCLLKFIVPIVVCSTRSDGGMTMF